MLQDAIKEISTLARAADSAADKVSIKKIDGDSRTLLIVNKEGVVTDRRLPEPTRGHVLSSVDQIPAFLTQAKAWEYTPVVFYHTAGVTIVIDGGPDDDRRHAASVVFTHTPEFAWLSLAKKGAEVDQKQFIRLLRTTFVDSMDDEPAKALIASLRRIKFVNISTTTGRAEHGRESLGREIDGECQADLANIPERIVLSVSPFSDRALPQAFDVRVNIDIDTRANTFTLTSVENDLNDAVEMALDALHQQLADAVKDVPIFFGRP